MLGSCEKPPPPLLLISPHAAADERLQNVEQQPAQRRRCGLGLHGEPHEEHRQRLPAMCTPVAQQSGAGNSDGGRRCLGLSSEVTV